MYSSMIGINIKLENGAKLPIYATKGAACMDIHAFLEEPIILYKQNVVSIRTGLHVEVPEGYELQLVPRSGLAFSHNITLVNSPGTIDSDYRGEIKIGLINHGFQALRIFPGDRIAQISLVKVPKIVWNVVEELSSTERGAGGFGSSGMQGVPSFLEGHINNKIS